MMTWVRVGCVGEGVEGGYGHRYRNDVCGHMYERVCGHRYGRGVWTQVGKGSLEQVRKG